MPTTYTDFSNRLAHAHPVLTAFACCAVPIVTVIICTTWSMGAGLIEACIPFIDGCTSISRACRQIPVLYFFRTIMLPCSVLLILFWWQERNRLKHQEPERVLLRRVATLLALVGAFFLVPYVIFLGTTGPIYEFLRRIGIYFFFAGTGFAQVIITLGVETGRIDPIERRLRRLRQLLVTILLALGPLNLLLKAMLVDPDAAENVIEWWFGLALFLWFGVMSVTRCNAERCVRKQL